jgi:hypothetical protein
LGLRGIDIPNYQLNIGQFSYSFSEIAGEAALGQKNAILKPKFDIKPKMVVLSAF